MIRPKLFMMIGAPYSGKSTWAQNLKRSFPRTILVSSDAYIEATSRELGLTYSEVFEGAYPAAEKSMMQDVKLASSSLRDAVWDQTNLTVRSRAKKLAMFPDIYTKIAVLMPLLTDQELEERVARRVDKIIGLNIVRRMMRTMEVPTTAEGFDTIISAERAQ